MKLKKWFATGLAVLLPAFLTYVLIKWIFNLLVGLVGFIPTLFLKETTPLVKTAVEIVSLILLFFGIALIGKLAGSYIGKRVHNLFDKTLASIPLAGPIYTSTKQLVEFIFSMRKTTENFKTVVLFRWPHKDVWAIGFATGTPPESFKPDSKKEFVNVFMPSTPNPTTGFFMFVPREDVIFLDIPVEEAVKIIVSGGILSKNNDSKEGKNQNSHS